MANVNKYESVFIVNATLEQEAIDNTVNRFKALVEANGTLESVDEWGKRRMAYPIDDMNEGYYVLMTFNASPDFPKELDRQMRINTGIMRSLITCIAE